MSADIIDRNDLYTLLLEELDRRKIINASKVLSHIILNPLYMDFEKIRPVLDNIALVWTLWEKITAPATWELFYPIIVTDIKFINQ